MNTIKFQNPPARTRHRSPNRKTQAIIDQLKANPGQWAIVKEDTYPSNSVTWKKHGFETRSSTIGKTNGLCDLYARWVGDHA